MTLRVASLIALCILLSDISISYNEAKSTYRQTDENAEAKKEKLCRSIEFLTDSLKCNSQVQSSCAGSQALSVAQKARFVVNQADWATVATLSTKSKFPNWPAANLISVADGPVENGTGIPYMYLTPLDCPAQDLAKDHRASLQISLTQGSYCKAKQYDPMDPRCWRVTLTGTIKALKNMDKEKSVEKFFFDRHPGLRNMPQSHQFFFANFEIQEVSLLHTFGGHAIIPVADYLNAPVAICGNDQTEIESPFVYRSIV